MFHGFYYPTILYFRLVTKNKFKPRDFGAGCSTALLDVQICDRFKHSKHLQLRFIIIMVFFVESRFERLHSNSGNTTEPLIKQVACRGGVRFMNPKKLIALKFGIWY